MRWSKTARPWRESETIALGGRGGSRIPTAILQVFLALADGDQARAAVAQPRLHHQWLPDRLEHEAGALDEAALGELSRRGHQLVAAQELPKVNLLRRLADGSLEAAGDPRAGEVGCVARPGWVAGEAVECEPRGIPP